MTAILSRALRYGGIVTGVVVLVAGIIGYLVSGVPGLLGAVIGAVLSAVFLGLTAVSMLVAGRVTKGDGTNPLFFAIVLGTLGLKFILFLIFIIWLRGQTWMDPAVFAFTVIAAVLGSLGADILAFVRTRVPYVTDVRLPGEEGPNP